MTQIEDGFGQSVWDDIRWALRFRRIRCEPVPWRSPSPDEDQDICAHPTLGRFGDGVAAIAERGGRRWIVLENIWHGWPDPSRYALFVLEPDDAVWMAWGFHDWPTAWRRP